MSFILMRLFCNHSSTLMISQSKEECYAIARKLMKIYFFNLDLKLELKRRDSLFQHVRCMGDENVT